MALALRTGNLRALADDAVLIPVIRGQLMNKGFRAFTIKIDAWKPRPHDGWWHPSTHSGWDARKLALYLSHPHLVDEELMGMESMLAVTQGHFLHAFFGKILKRNGIAPELEIPLEDSEHRRRGHMDGVLTSWEGLEMKSINSSWAESKLNNAEELRERKPGYYAQAQDYMDMAQLENMRFLFFATFYPYPMTEFVVPRDEIFQARQRAKYREALASIEENRLPINCCNPGSKTAKGCELRGACPIGRAS